VTGVGTATILALGTVVALAGGGMGAWAWVDSTNYVQTPDQVVLAQNAQLKAAFADGLYLAAVALVVASGATLATGLAYGLVFSE